MTDAMTTTKTKTKKQKRSEPDIRKEMLSQGAFLFSFERLANPSNEEAYKVAIDQWRTMERKGFFVTADGCMLPYSYYRKSNQSGDTRKGHLRSVSFFIGREPDRSERYNGRGWPCDEQVSHLCHRPDCIRPDHLVIEARYKNAQRNYCGEMGSCDCRVVPKCVRTYHNPETFHEDPGLAADKDQVSALLAPLTDRFPFRIEAKTKYQVEDKKREHRNKRKKLQRKHEREAASKRNKQ